MKHITIDASTDATRSAEELQNTLNHDMTSRRDMYTPKPVLSTERGKIDWTVVPGQDGYRTPTIEDYELHRLAHQQHNGGLSNNSSHFRLPHPSPGFLSRPQLNLSSSNFGHSILEKLQWKERIRHFTWTFFTMTMATGGIANVLYHGKGYSENDAGLLVTDPESSVPFRFRGLEAIGVIFFLLNIVLFIFNTVMISLRFYCHPETFRASILHPTERLFIPAAVVSFGTILLNISQYGPNRAGHWLNDAVAVLYWIDAALAVLSSMGVYLVM